MTDARCPHCAQSLISGLIPEDLLLSGHYGDWNVGDNSKYFYSTIGVEVSGVYDGTLFYQCPHCSGRWHRFPENSELWRVADPYVTRERT